MFYNFIGKKFEETVNNEEVINYIIELNNDDSIDGIIVQMPLPSHLDPSLIQNAIDPMKDVDGLTNINGGKLIDYIYNRHSFFLIDEFQDNNDDYRKLLFYLSEKKDCFSPDVPKAPDLEKNKIFLVFITCIDIIIRKTEFCTGAIKLIKMFLLSCP